MKKTFIFLVVFILLYIAIIKFVNYNTDINENISYGDMILGVSCEDIYKPLNFKRQKAMWFTYMDYSEILAGKNCEEFENEISKRFKNAAMMGINTVYVQVRAFGDAYYHSNIFPSGKYYTDYSYDPLEIMISKAHSYGLSFHAWINPLRCGNSDEISLYDDICKYLSEVDGRLWLNPAYDETIEYVCSGVREITENYRVDGIHIDDYFYPTTDISFDSSEFAASGESDLAKWRKANTDRLVHKIYSTVKSVNKSLLFGISPQGNMVQNTDVQFADVEKWIKEEGYCDYIVPQIYYGYKNEASPFSETVNKWRNIASSNTDIIIGLCTYKNGTEDEWAGSGINEWTEDNMISARQVRDCVLTEKIDGIAIYSYSSTFGDCISADIMAAGPIQEIRECLKEY